ncbi:MAG: O-antigen ligase domain-containing protein [Bacteroidetes bacterium]|nr:MAG: O-antigen ligase domain-containing protein [Bacteroidota bacterium]
MYSLASIIFILYKFQFGKRFEKILSWWTLLLVAINFTLTVSRSSILGAAIIIMIFTFYYHRKWFYAGLIAGALAGLALLIFPILLDVLRLASNPFSYRDQLFELAISKWKERMLFGQGYGTTLIMTTELFTFLQKGYHYLLIGKHFGNMYLELLSETGILGFVLFVPIIVILYKKQKKLWQIARGDYKVFLVLYRGLFWGFLIQNVFESALLAPGNGVAFLFWTFSGLLLSFERLMLAEEGTQTT